MLFRSCGVGMDVVRTEVASLGGRIAISFEQGKGSRFSIYLPLTLAVTQAVLARAGGKTYAIPTVMVEQVQQLRAEQLERIRAAGHVEWASRRYPFFYLPELLGEPDENSFGTPDVAEPVDALVIDDFIDHFRAEPDEPRKIGRAHV